MKRIPICGLRYFIKNFLNSFASVDCSNQLCLRRTKSFCNKKWGFYSTHLGKQTQEKPGSPKLLQLINKTEYKTMSEEFSVVTRKKWIARKSLQKRPRRISDRSYEPDGCPEVDVDKFIKRLETLCEQMKTSDYFTQAIATLAESVSELELPPTAQSTSPSGRASEDKNKFAQIKRLVCFGIGPFTRNFQALHQLAFIVSAQRHCGITEAIYFDPVFRDSERQVLQRLQCVLMTENCEAKYETNEPTLFYLPHCPNCLTNNLLWRNWRTEGLRNLILINNSFESLAASKPERMLRLDSNYILDVLPYAQELPLEDDYETHNIFNDLSVHVFPVSKLPPEESEFWAQREAPTYTDVEMISAADFAKLSIT